MASFYRNKYVSDIPLKRPQETFVDDPGSLDEVCLDDLVFDVANDIKNVNNLHGFHALAIYRAVLEDLIFLTTNKDALMKFRRQQLQMYSLDLDTLSREVDGQERAGQNLQMGSKSPEPSPMLHLASPGSTGLLNAGASAGKCGSATSLGEVPGSELPPAQTQKQPPRSPFMAQADYSDISLVTTPAETESESGETKRSSETKGGFISTESLVKTTSLEIPSDPITRHNIERLKNEVLSHMSPEIKRQEDHLLRCFSLSKAPPITIEQFLVRIKTYSPSISVSVYIHSAYMIYKLCVLLG
ncbi:hypothetical protein JCM33374_g2623 [Metschnikowia sp. JCM 33374]|nr:hypothetical protein JCM33374_g2623 [Metschnikowia sp. JCM 33374]